MCVDDEKKETVPGVQTAQGKKKGEDGSHKRTSVFLSFGTYQIALNG